MRCKVTHFSALSEIKKALSSLTMNIFAMPKPRRKDFCTP